MTAFPFHFSSKSPSDWTYKTLDWLDVAAASFYFLLIPLIFKCLRVWEYKNGVTFRFFFYSACIARIINLIVQLLQRESMLEIPRCLNWFISTLPLMLIFSVFVSALCAWGRIFILAEQEGHRKHTVSIRIRRYVYILYFICYLVFFSVNIVNVVIEGMDNEWKQTDATYFVPPLPQAIRPTEQTLLALLIVIYVAVPFLFLGFIFFEYNQLYTGNIFHKDYMTEKSKSLLRRLSIVTVLVSTIFMIRAVVLILNEFPSPSEWQDNLWASIVYVIFLDIVPSLLLLGTAGKRKISFIRLDLDGSAKKKGSQNNSSYQEFPTSPLVIPTQTPKSAKNSYGTTND
eukprot:TRINITY_DN4907_c0_g1_i1.p1 TRINITY_DN4907_c0_g1~~TRINITY_DN4907_c0_g1_i1.p1  ORF type:complete len:343 (-),score=104.38 TRINITY_DN4907_c0_g1_i1:191-1219(-)